MRDRLAASFSGMMLYEGCPSAYKRRYIDKEVLPEVAPHKALLRGLEVHSGVDNFLSGDDCGVPGPARSFQSMMETLRGERDVRCELKFALSEDWQVLGFDDIDVMIRGVLDGIYEHECVIHVMEWKTGKWYAEHEKQRSLYALAGLALYPELDDVLVQTVYFDLSRVEFLELNRKYSPAHQRVWKGRADGVQPPQEYPQTPNWKCTGKKKWCDYHLSKGGTCNGRPCLK